MHSKYVKRGGIHRREAWKGQAATINPREGVWQGQAAGVHPRRGVWKGQAAGINPRRGVWEGQAARVDVDIREDSGKLKDRGLDEPVTLTFTVTHGTTPTPTALPTGVADDLTLSIVVLPLPLSTTVRVSPSVLATAPGPIVGIPTLGSSLSSTTTTATSSSSSSTTPVSVATTSTTPTSTSTSVSSTGAAPTPSGSNAASNSNLGDGPSVRLSSGAIAGIVVGCLVVLLVAVLFGMRKRSANNRSRLRGVWARSKALRVGDVEPTPYTYQSPIEGGGTLDSQDQRMNFVTGAQPGSISMPTSPRSMASLPQALPSAYGYGYAIGSAGLGGGIGSPPVVAGTQETVIRSFVPSLPDELSISPGEKLQIVQVFDDGWAECMNYNGEVGMVPVECFEKAAKTGGERRMSTMMTREETGRNSRRYTSLPK